MSLIRLICRLVVGFVFIFSGFVKAVDPMGSTYKFSDYFIAFGLDSLQAIAFPLAILLSTLEFTVGMAIFFNTRKKLAAWGALLFMLFFTPLTLVLAITDPVTDCGCFGDALILTNWETFSKNVVILAFSVILFAGRNKEADRYAVWKQNLMIGFSVFVSVWISVYSYIHLPIIDFRPYHIGANISEGMMIPEGAQADEYRSILKYKKDGVVKEFDESNYPWQDSTWIFVDAEQILVKKGYVPPIHDFSISNEINGDITDEILNSEGYTFLLVTKDLNKINPDVIPRVQEVALFAMEHGHNFIGITASSPQDYETFKSNHELPFDFYNTDEIQLKTIVRANPGLVLMKKGTILDKWHYNDFPAAKMLKGDLAAHSITKHQKINIKLVIISITTTLLLLISLFTLISGTSRVKK